MKIHLPILILAALTLPVLSSSSASASAASGPVTELLQGFSNNSGEMQTVDPYGWYYFRGRRGGTADTARVILFTSGSAPARHVAAPAPFGDGVPEGYLVIASSLKAHLFYTFVDIPEDRGIVGLAVDMKHDGEPEKDVWRFVIRVGRDWFVSEDSIRGKPEWRRYFMGVTGDSKWLPLRFEPDNRLMVGMRAVTFAEIRGPLSAAGIYGEPESSVRKRFDNFTVTSGYKER